MKNDFEPEDDIQARLDGTVAEVNSEARRVGVDWERLDAVLTNVPPPDHSDDHEEIALGLDADELLAALKQLPDGAGTSALLQALGFESKGRP